MRRAVESADPIKDECAQYVKWKVLGMCDAMESQAEISLFFPFLISFIDRSIHFLISFFSADEIDVGICDGLTYEEIETTFKEEFELRSKDKLRYRYPRGESYEDVVRRFVWNLLSLSPSLSSSLSLSFSLTYCLLFE